PLRLELVPSGHMLGGAQALVECDAGRLLYAGRINPAGTATAAPAWPRRADVVLIDGDFGLERHILPSRDETAEHLTRGIESTVGSGAPVVLAETPGAAEDVVATLARFPLVVHREIAEHTREYLRLGVKVPQPRTFRGHLAPSEVLVWPSSLRASRTLA